MPLKRYPTIPEFKAMGRLPFLVSACHRHHFWGPFHGGTKTWGNYPPGEWGFGLGKGLDQNLIIPEPFYFCLLGCTLIHSPWLWLVNKHLHNFQEISLSY